MILCYFLIRCRTALPRSVRCKVWLGLRLESFGSQAIKPSSTRKLTYFFLLVSLYGIEAFKKSCLVEKSLKSNASKSLIIDAAVDAAFDAAIDAAIDAVNSVWYCLLIAFIALAASSSPTQLCPRLVTQSLPTTLPFLSTTSSSVTKSL